MVSKMTGAQQANFRQVLSKLMARFKNGQKWSKWSNMVKNGQKMVKNLRPPLPFSPQVKNSFFASPNGAYLGTTAILTIKHLWTQMCQISCNIIIQPIFYLPEILEFINPTKYQRRPLFSRHCDQ